MVKPAELDPALKAYLDAKFNALVEQLRVATVKIQLATVESHLAALDSRVAALENRVSGLEQRMITRDN